MSKTIGPYRLNPRGDYNPAADPLYSLLDLVSDGGGSFVYTNPTPSNEPTSSTSHWQQIASQGTTGPSAYDAAVAGGYTGTEAEFNAANAGLPAAVEGANDAAENANTAADRSMLWRKTASGNPVSAYPVPESPLYPKVSGTFTQEGTGDPSPSNIRPISSWLASGATAKVKRTGKNLLSKLISDITLITGIGTLTVNDGVANYTKSGAGGIYGIILSGIDVTPNTDYTVSASVVKKSGSYGPSLSYGIRFHGVQTDTYSALDNNFAKTWNSGANTSIEILFYFASGQDVEIDVDVSNIQLELGATATTYEPYTESEITLTAPQEVPAGWMDNEEHGQITGQTLTLIGAESFMESPVDLGTVVRVRLYLATPFTGGGIFSHFTTLADYMSDTEHAYMDGVLIMLFIAKSRLSAIDDNGVKAWIAAQYAGETPLTIGYQLATPVSITPAVAPLTALPQLDRVTPRQNVLTASTGNVELTYAKSPIREADELAAAIALL